jgi:hypothetical protein
MPEIRHPHGLPEIVQAPGPGQSEDAADAVGHLRGLFECDHNGHVQRKDDCGEAQDQQYHDASVGFSYG